MADATNKSQLKAGRGKKLLCVYAVYVRCQCK